MTVSRRGANVAEESDKAVFMMLKAEVRVNIIYNGI